MATRIGVNDKSAQPAKTKVKEEPESGDDNKRKKKKKKKKQADASTAKEEHPRHEQPYQEKGQHHTN
eukprot:NODE_3039_length_386_cov_4.400593_g2957_i0.p4 GENE.NODE_3039_length_386_cov_4.400593_g2957_i0~~NODE_3039_length_386_cov_4.400593_g2957_i0.p4  ORF type:complete len:67 (-),score=26.86 NODE_3039_length_386_cov_4.400593_g2957_i0:102-302(-)